MNITILAIIFSGLLFGDNTFQNEKVISERITVSDNTLLDEKLALGVDAFYRTDWEQADRIFSELISEEPDNPMPYFFSSMMPFWEYFFVDQSEEKANQFLEKSQRAVELSEKRLSSSPKDTTMVLMLSGLYGYRSLVAAGESNYRIALQSGLTGFNYTRKLLSINSDRADAKIGRGMFYYMVGSIPSGMRWASNAVGIRGDIELGFAELKEAAASDSYISNDAKLMLMYLYDKEERYEESLEYATMLVEQFPENVIFKFKKAEVHLNLDNIQSAKALFEEIVDADNPSLSRLTEISKSKIFELENLTLKH